MNFTVTTSPDAAGKTSENRIHMRKSFFFITESLKDCYFLAGICTCCFSLAGFFYHPYVITVVSE